MKKFIQSGRDRLQARTFRPIGRNARRGALPATAASMAVCGAMCAAPPGFPNLPGRLNSPKPVAAEDLVRMRASVWPSPQVAAGGYEIAVALDIEPGWHVYWEHSGDSGAPTEIDVVLPEDAIGWKVGTPRFPYPQAFDSAGERTYGYEKQVVFFVPVTPPSSESADTPRPAPDSDESAPPATPPITASVEVFYLVCKGSCLMGEAAAQVTLPTDGPRGTRVPAEIERFRARLPQPLAERRPGSDESHNPPIRARLTRDRLIVEWQADDLDDLHFYPLPVPVVVLGAVEATSRGLEVPVVLEPRNALGNAPVVRGVVVLGEGDDARSFTIDLPVTNEEPQP